MIDIDRRDRLSAFRFVGFQAAVGLLLATAGLVFRPEIALSLLIGSVIGVAGSTWLVFIVFRPSALRPAKEMLVSFYLGEIGRFLIVMILFILAFKGLVLLREPGNALMVFLAFLVSQAVIAFAPRLAGLTR